MNNSVMRAWLEHAPQIKPGVTHRAIRLKQNRK